MVSNDSLFPGRLDGYVGTLQARYIYHLRVRMCMSVCARGIVCLASSVPLFAVVGGWSCCACHDHGVGWCLSRVLLVFEFRGTVDCFNGLSSNSTAESD